MTIFRSFRSTVNPFTTSRWPANLKLLVDPVTGAPTGIESPNASGPNGIWTPVDLTAAQIASPTALMIADLNATYRLNVAPYTRYQSDGTTLQATTGGGVFLPLAGGTVTGATTFSAAGTGLAVTNDLVVSGRVRAGGAAGLYTWSGTSTAQAPIGTGATELTWTGSVGNIGSPAPIGLFIRAGTIMDASANAGNGVGGAVVQLNNWTGAKGDITGYYGSIDVGEASGTSGAGSYTGGHFFTNASINNGGTSPQPAGVVVGIKGTAQLVGTATFWQTAYSGEFVMNVGSGASVDNKHGVLIVETTGDATQGRVSDSAISVINQYVQTSSTGWKVGIDIGGASRAGLANPLSTTATAFLLSKGALDGTLTIDTGFDLSAVDTITSWILKTKTLTIDGTGNIVAPKIDNGSTGLTVFASGAKGVFFGGTPIVKPTGVAVTAAGIHAALVSLNLIAA